MFAYKSSLIKIAMFLAILNCASYGVADNQHIPHGMCECGAFMEETENSELIFSYSPISVTCNKEGQDKCLKLCSDLAFIGMENGPELICRHLEEIEAVQPSMFINTCEDGWIYGNITSEDVICCQEDGPIPCPNQDY